MKSQVKTGRGVIISPATLAATAAKQDRAARAELIRLGVIAIVPPVQIPDELIRQRLIDAGVIQPAPVAAVA